MASPCVVEPRVRRAGADDAPGICTVLEQALEEEPFVRWLVGARGARGRRRYVRLMLRLTVPYGHVYTTADRDGASLWVPPGSWESTAWTQLLLLPRIAWAVGVRRLMTFAECSERIERARPLEPGYHLALLGVRAQARGKGLGGALLEPVLSKCDRDGVAATLETAADSNVDWYRRFGFEVVARVELPGDGPTVRCMARQPAAAAAVQ